MDVHGYICKLFIKTDSSKKELLLENILSEKKIVGYVPLICMCWFPNETQFLHFWSMGKVTETCCEYVVFHFQFSRWTGFYLFIELSFPPPARWYPDIKIFGDGKE